MVTGFAMFAEKLEDTITKIAAAALTKDQDELDWLREKLREQIHGEIYEDTGLLYVEAVE